MKTWCSGIAQCGTIEHLLCTGEPTREKWNWNYIFVYQAAFTRSQRNDSHFRSSSQVAT